MKTKKKEGMLKSDKLLVAGLSTVVAGMGLSMLCLVGMVGDLIGSIAVNSKKEEFLEAATNVPAYQEYFLEEKDKLDDLFASGELSSKEYRIKFNELENETKENFVAEHGTEEQIQELQRHNGKQEVVDKVCDAFAIASAPGFATAIAGIVVTKKGENEMKKENAERGETDEDEKE